MPGSDCRLSFSALQLVLLLGEGRDGQRIIAGTELQNPQHATPDRIKAASLRMVTG